MCLYIYSTYIYLVIGEALLHLVEQAAVRELAEGCEVIIRGRRHQFYLEHKTQYSIE